MKYEAGDIVREIDPINPRFLCILAKGQNKKHYVIARDSSGTQVFLHHDWIKPADPLTAALLKAQGYFKM